MARDWGKISGIDEALIRSLENRVDREMAAALRDAAGVREAIEGTGPLASYYQEVEDAAMEAIRALPDVDPTNPANVRAIQERIRDYGRVTSHMLRILAQAEMIAAEIIGPAIEDDEDGVVSEGRGDSNGEGHDD